MKIPRLFIVSSIIVATAGFVACSGSGVSADASASDSTRVVGSHEGEIAYVRMDSLMQGYGMFVDLSAAFAAKQEKAQNELTSKGRAIEKEAGDFQAKIQQGTVTSYQAAAKEQELIKKQQDLMDYRDRTMGELAEEEMVISGQISAAVMEYLREYNKDKKYSMIFQTTGGTPILLADPSLDITAEVLEELNKRYLADLEKQQKK